MRQSCLASMAIAQRQARAHTGCHSCWRLAGLAEAHGRRHSGRAAAAIEGWARVAASLLEAVRRTAMSSQVMAVARDVGRAEGMVAVAVVAVAAAEAAAAAQLVAGIARAREPAWARAATWRKTCWRW